VKGYRYLPDVATLTLDVEKCTGCGLCATVCPHRIFAVEDGRARILDLDACMECGACELNCAWDAIGVHAGVGCASAIINSWIRGGAPSCGDADSETAASGGDCC
jgi:ferredoxin